MTENRCLRCNRKLKDVNALYGWRCAQILGVDQDLNLSGDRTWDAFHTGAAQAAQLLRESGLEPSNIDAAKFYRAMIQAVLAKKLGDETMYQQAQRDARDALLASGKLGWESAGPVQALPLKEAMRRSDAADYRDGLFRTDAYLDRRPTLETLLLQRKLNGQGAANQFGEPLKEDGLFGPNTLWAALKGVNTTLQWYLKSLASRSLMNTVTGVDQFLDLFYNVDWRNNYAHNKGIDFQSRVNYKVVNGQLWRCPATDSEGYIVDQNQLSDIRFGEGTSDNNGCGWIATYNALKMLGEDPDAAEIIKDLEQKGSLRRGTLGADPNYIGVYFRNKGYKVTYSYVEQDFEKIAGRADANIYMYLRPNISGHYVAFRPESRNVDGTVKTYTFYNSGSERGEWYPNPLDYEGNPYGNIWDTRPKKDTRSFKAFLDSDEHIFQILISITKP